MIPDEFLDEQLMRLQTLHGFKTLLENPIEHKRAMKEAETKSQLEQAFTALIMAEGRRYCPQPGEIVEAIRNVAREEEMAGERDSAECWRCHGRGHWVDSCKIHVPCNCAIGKRWRELHPDLVQKWESECQRIEESLSKRQAAPSRRHHTRSMGQVDQVLRQWR